MWNNRENRIEMKILNRKLYHTKKRRRKNKDDLNPSSSKKKIVKNSAFFVENYIVEYHASFTWIYGLLCSKFQ